MLYGDIPFSISKLKQLELLNLRNNQLTGPIPSTLTQIPNLKTLDLARNQLIGRFQCIDRRPDISNGLKTLKCRTLIFVGDNSPFYAEAVHMTSKLDRRYCALVEVAKRHLTQRIENLDGKLDQQVDISKEIRVDVTKARDDLSKIDYDLGTMQFTLEGLNGQLLELGRKQRISMQERMQKHIEAYGNSAPGLMESFV